MTDDVQSLAAARALKSGDNRKWTPVDCLLDCLNDIRMKNVVCDKLLILRLNTGGGEKFDIGFNCAGAKASEIIAMLECAKIQILQEMGYVPT